jgi:hypothetical protein
VTQPPKKIVVVNTTKRDTILGVLGGAVLLALLAFGFIHLSQDVTGKGLTGIITSKTFTPQPEEQITIGQGGPRARRIEGEYRFEVNVDSRIYTVWVDKLAYDTKEVGDRFYFMPPPPKPQ